MGFFDKFFKPKKADIEPNPKPHIFVNGIPAEPFPSISKYRVNPSGKRYDDTYITGVNYKLRELLLLIWWGRTKNPRKSTVTPPRYFFYEYHLNTKETTQMFIRDGVLSRDDQGRIILTDLGRQLYNEFAKLWEIHSYQGTMGELPNLDQVFHNWNYNEYKANNDLLQVAFLSEIINYNSKMQSYHPVGSDDYNAYQYDIDQDKEEIENLLAEHARLTNGNQGE